MILLYILLLIPSRKKMSCRQKVSEITSQDATYSEELGIALFDVYGTSIPPDATFTLRNLRPVLLKVIRIRNNGFPHIRLSTGYTTGIIHSIKNTRLTCRKSGKSSIRFQP